MATPPSSAAGSRRLKCRFRLWACPLLAAGAAQTQAQTLTQTPRFEIVPSISVQETVTDNRDLTSAKAADSITQISPAIRISSRAGRVQGTLDYALNMQLYARASERNQAQNALGANVRAEVVENHVFVDARASISQQTISAFGTQASGTNLANENRSEVSNVTIAPRVTGSLWGVADVQASVVAAAARSASTDAGDSDQLAATVGISGGKSFVGWGLNASRNVSRYKVGAHTTQDTLVGSLTVRPNPELQLSLRDGREANDVRTGSREFNNTSGWGIGWRPGERTSLDVQSDNHYYGHSHGLTFQHRMQRSIWRYADSRGVVGDTQPRATGQPVSLFDLLFAQYASLEADPVRREQLVRALLSANGLDPNSALGGGFLSTGLSVQRYQTLSVVATGLRSTGTLSAFRSQNRRLGSMSQLQGDLARVPAVDQLGYSVAVGHRLTPTSSLNVSADRVRTFDAPGQPGIDQRIVTLLWSGNFGQRTTASLGARHTWFDSVSNPYNESAVIGSVGLRF